MNINEKFKNQSGVVVTIVSVRGKTVYFKDSSNLQGFANISDFKVRFPIKVH